MRIATNSSKIDISKENKTASLAKIFSTFLNKGDIVFLYGEIGAGKTTFARYLINYLQLRSKKPLSEVTSPTFNLLNEYKTNNLVIKHYDLFRIKNNSEINDLDIFEKNKKTITLVEWPQIIVNKNSAKSIDLLFSYENEFKNRTVQIKVLN